jgi:simple sugar transport system permease protein
VTLRLFVASGAVAGVAGAAEVGGVTWALYEGLSPGYGYTAIAVALLARLEPRYLLPSALFFGAIEAGGAAMQREAGVPFPLVQVLVAVVLVGVLAAGRWHADRALTPPNAGAV